MSRFATSIALAATAIAVCAMPAEAQRRGDDGRRAERMERPDRGRDMPRDDRRDRPDFERQRDRGGPAGCRGGGSVIGAIAGGLLGGGGAAGRPC